MDGQVSSGEWEVRKEATHVVCNMVTIGTAAHIAHLVRTLTLTLSIPISPYLAPVYIAHLVRTLSRPPI